MSITEIGFEQLASLPLETSNCLFLDLSHTLAGEVELGTDFLKCHFLTPDAEEHLQDFTFAVIKLAQGTVNLLG